LVSHPGRAQVPPKGLESMMPTSYPAALHSWTTVEAGGPAPITDEIELLSHGLIFPSDLL